MRDRAIYIGNFAPSRMDAQTQLIIGNCKILKELGFKVTLVCNDSDVVERGEDYHYSILDGFECYSLKFSKSIQGALASRDMFELVKSILETVGSNSIAYVICYGSLGFAVQMHWLSRWCKKEKIKIIANCADLPDVKHGSGVERFVKRIDRDLRNYSIASQMDGLIAVSGYIKQFFSQRSNYPIAVIPPLKDTKELDEYVFPPREKIKKIAYVGVPFPIDGRKVDESAYKDRIDLFIDLLCSATCRDWRLDIYGMTREQYSCVVTRHVDLLKKYQNQIVFHGRVGHDEALRVVADADYSVVYRLKNRMTMAGFSTKFVESVSCGTPVLMTDTSEYIKYAEKGVPCVILDLESAEQRKRALEDALRQTPDEMIEMKERCRNSHAFDYRQYTQLMRDFLERVSTGVGEN